MNKPHFPTEEGHYQRANKTPALNENLLNQVVATVNVHEAWKQVKRNKGVAGIDGVSIDDFAEIMRPQWHTIKAEILSGRYRPQP